MLAPNEETRKELRSKLAEVERLYREKDIKVVDTYHPDAKLLEQGSPIVIGKPAIKDHYQKNLFSGDYTLKMTQDEMLELANDTVLIRGKSLVFEGEQQIMQNKYILLEKKVDGKWLTYIDMYNSDT